MLLVNKKALITGSSSGIGLGVARAFVSAGAEVIVSSERPLADLPEVAGLINTGKARYLQADMTVDGEPARLVEAAWAGESSSQPRSTVPGRNRHTLFTTPARVQSTRSPGNWRLNSPRTSRPWRSPRDSWRHP